MQPLRCPSRLEALVASAPRPPHPVGIRPTFLTSMCTMWARITPGTRLDPPVGSRSLLRLIPRCSSHRPTVRGRVAHPVALLEFEADTGHGPFVSVPHVLDLFHPPRLQSGRAAVGTRGLVLHAGLVLVLIAVPPLGRCHMGNAHLGGHMGDWHTGSDAHHQTASLFGGQRCIRVGHGSGILDQDTNFDTPHPARGRNSTTTTSHPTTPSPNLSTSGCPPSIPFVQSVVQGRRL